MFRFVCSSTLLLFFLVCIAIAEEKRDGFEFLFNGRDLDNWVLTNTVPETWTIRDSMLICSGKPYGEIRTREMYQNFVFEVEWRHLVPGGNAGIFLWADDIPAKGVPFHRGIEVQVLEHAYGNTRSYTTHGDIFPIHGASMTPDNGRGGSRAFPTELRGRPAPEWNHYRIICNDGTVTLKVNGAKVTSGNNCTPRKGYLCLESEGGIVHYRNMKIKKLPDTPINSKDIAISNRGYQSVYTGLNLSGWRSEKTELKNETERDGWTATDWKLRHDGPETRLASIPTAGRTAVLIDVRRTSDNATAKISIAGSGNVSTLAILATKGSTAHLNNKPDQWNRIECDWNSRTVQLKINGTATGVRETPDGIDSKFSLLLDGTGAVEFANLFVK